jgi:hypothetical protein
MIAAASQMLLLLAVDFRRDVAPILRAKCAGCHRPGEVAPFPLLTYGDAESRAKTIAAVVEKGLMPPWKPVHGFGEFQNERRLTKREAEQVVKWASSAKAERGGEERTQEVPSESPAWKLGEPDLVIGMPKPFAIAAEGSDEYRCFVVPVPRGIHQYIRAWEFQPGNRRTVHHALFFLDSSHEGARRAESEGGSYSCFGVPGFMPSGSLGGWSPGSAPFTATEGTAAGHVRAGEDLVMQIHYHATGKPEADQSRIGLYFDKTYSVRNPPPKRVVDVALVSKQIDIPAGEAAYKVQDHFTLPIDVWAIGIIPHAHYIARQVQCRATLPDGKIRWLLRIDDWDFNWQDQYRYAKAFVLPRDTRLDMEIVYDNSAHNPRNPNVPPQRVVWGPDSTDEMAGVHLQAIPVRMEELPELGQALWGKIMRAVGGGFYRPPEKQQ